MTVSSHKKVVSGFGQCAVSRVTVPVLCVSVVLYRPDLALLELTLSSLARALAIADISAELVLVDNGSISDTARSWLAGFAARLPRLRTEILRGHGNVGYGGGHNLAIRRSRCDLHLVLNPDVELAPDALAQALRFLRDHPQAGLLAPAVSGRDGRPQYLCKRYPSVLDLALRGFAPMPLRRLFRRRLARYEMRDQIHDRVVWDLPVVSGCFMLIRRQALSETGGFSSAYFLYFEDFDLSLRLARVTRSAYLPQMKIVHYGGGAAAKGLRHVSYFVRSAVTFFNRHGWRWS